MISKDFLAVREGAKIKKGGLMSMLVKKRG